MKSDHNVWMRIAALARQAPKESIDAPPPGFETRVVARAFEARRRPDEFIVRYSLRALGVATALAVVCAMTNISLLAGDTLAGGYADDPVGEIITELWP